MHMLVCVLTSVIRMIEIVDDSFSYLLFTTCSFDFIRVAVGFCRLHSRNMGILHLTRI